MKAIALIVIVLLTGCSESKYIERRVCTAQLQADMKEYLSVCLNNGGSPLSCKSTAKELYCPYEFIKNPNWNA